MTLNPLRWARAMVVGAVAGVLVAKDVLAASPPPETTICPVCGEEHEVIRLEGVGMPVLLCEQVPEGHPRIGPPIPYTLN